MPRLKKYNFIINSSIASKSVFFSPASIKPSIKLIAGLYKPSSVKLEHGLVLSSIAGNIPVAKPQLHGKRQKRTTSLNISLSGDSTWLPMDKIIHEILPKISDFRTPKFKKPNKSIYTIRFKQKFTPLTDFEDLISSEMYDSHRGIFLPLTMHIIFNKDINHQASEHYMRMMRIPLSFYNRRSAPAFDDLASFKQSF